MRFAANHLKMIYVKRTPELSKTIHVLSSAFKATLTWHNMRTLQVRNWNLKCKLKLLLYLALLKVVDINIRNAVKPAEGKV